MTKQELNDLVRQYEPLINKIVGQFSRDKNIKCAWEDLKSMAYEGFSIAIEKYDGSRSDMNFTQYAAYAIRNNILTSINEEIRTVKLSAYAQQKAKDAGEPLFNTLSIDHNPVVSEEDDQCHPREIVMGMYENEHFSDGDVFEYLYSRIEAKFSKRDCDFFYRVYGLKDYDEHKSKEVAQIYGVSEGFVSQRLKMIILYIRKDKELCEMLASLLS